MKTRRDVLKIMAAAPAAASAQHSHSGEPLFQIAAPPAPKVFSPDQFRFLTRLVDLIIPRSDTPGAADAGVPHGIDRLAADPAIRAEFEQGLSALDTLARFQKDNAFLDLSEAEQIELLQAISGDMNSLSGRFFQLAKSMTADAYYTTREGLERELGWHGNTFLSSFPGCTHPEHQG